MTTFAELVKGQLGSDSESPSTNILDRYVQEVLPVSMGGMTKPDAEMTSVREVLFRFASRAGTERARRGCMMCNVALEVGTANPAVHRAFQRYTQGITAAFANALCGDARAGQLPPELNPNDEARLCTATALGMFALLKGGGDPETLEAAARSLLNRLSV